MAHDMVSEIGQEDERRRVVEGVLDEESDDLPTMREGVAPSPSGDWAGVTSAEKLFPPPLSTSAFVLPLVSSVISSDQTKKIDSLRHGTFGLVCSRYTVYNLSKESIYTLYET